MSNILFAWEFGANWGHLSRGLPIAKRLRDAGHHILFVVCDTKVAAEILSPAGFSFVQAPLTRRPVRATMPLANHAEMLIASGYGDLGTLRGLVNAWCGLLDLFNPEVIVLDYAPTALLAAKIRAIPNVLTGSGFELPPHQSPLPSFRPWEKIPSKRLLLAEAVVLNNINTILANCNTQPLMQFADVFDSEDKILTTFRELDHYGMRSKEVYVGPVYEIPDAHSVQWDPQITVPRIFAYLRPDTPQIESLLSALRESGADVICACPGISSHVIEKFSTHRLRIFPMAISIDVLLPSASMVVACGHGTITTALLFGIPLLLVPLLTEQMLIALHVEALGAGLIVRKSHAQIDHTNAIEALISNPNFRTSAEKFAQKYHEYRQENAVDYITSVIMSKMGTIAHQQPPQSF